MNKYINLNFFILLLLSLLFNAALLNSQDDIEHSMVKKMPGFKLKKSLSKKSNFSIFQFRIIENKKIITLEKKGRYWKLVYHNLDNKGKFNTKISKIDIMNNYRAAAKEMGGKVLYAKRGRITFTLPLNNGGILWAYVTALDGNYDLIIIEEEGFKKQLVFSADQMKRTLDSLGTISIYDINFDTAKDKLKYGAEKVLVEIVKLMKNYPELIIEIQGHTDNVGLANYNLDLSNKRADTVKDYLLLFGVEKKRMIAKGYGLSKPIVSNDTEEGRAKNRRVELLKLN
ncbi:MAG: OmpA family protein [Bacteroidetes bacterium]|nr:OmpA family protein [Bacteroidota bacterium]